MTMRRITIEGSDKPLYVPSSMSKDEVAALLKKNPPPPVLASKMQEKTASPEADKRPWYERAVQKNPATEEENKKIMASDKADLGNILTMGVPIAKLGELMKNAGPLMKGAANIGGRIGQGAALGATQAYGNDQGVAEGALAGGGFQTALEALFPAVRGLTRAATLLFKGNKSVENFRENVIGHPVDELKKTIQGQINHWIQKKSAGEGGPRTPEEAKAMMQGQYTTQEGRPMPVDIGTLTGERNTEGVYEGTGYLPFTGTANRKRSIQEEQSNNEIADLKKQLGIENAEAGNTEQAFNANSQLIKDKKVEVAQKKVDKLQAKVEAQFKNIEENKQRIEEENAKAQQEVEAKRERKLAEREPLIAKVEANANAHEEKSAKQLESEERARMLREHITQAPQKLQEMHASRLNRSAGEEKKFTAAQIPEMHAYDVQKKYKENQTEAKKQYGGLNEANHVVEIEPHGDFDEFKRNIQTLDANNARTNEIIGADLGRSVNQAIEAGKKFANGGEPYAVQVNDMVKHMQNLGKAAHMLREKGENVSAAAIEKLDRSMEKGFVNSLERNGHEQLAKDYKKGTKYYRENVVPFWKDSTIRKAALGKGVPKETTLSNKLHETEHQKILHSLPLDTQRSMAAEVIGKGKGTSSGLVNQEPEAIAKTYAASLSKNQKAAIARHSPEEDEYFENLRHALSEHKNVDTEAKRLASEVEKHEAKIALHAGQISDIELQHALIKDAKTKKVPSKKLLENLVERLEEAHAKREEIKISEPKKYASSSGLVGKLEAAEARRNSIKSERGIFGSLPGIGGAAVTSHYFPKLIAGAILGGRPTAKMLSDPAMIQAYINKQPMDIKQALIKKLMEKSPQFSALMSENGE